MVDWQYLADESAVLAYGAALARQYPAAGLVTLHGDLGAGKTTLVRGWLQALGHGGNVKSPTYTLVEPYHLQGRDIYHFDLYRLADPAELDYLGFRDYLHPGNLCLVEWPEKAGSLLPPADLSIHLRHAGAGREIAVFPVKL